MSRRYSNSFLNHAVETVFFDRRGERWRSRFFSTVANAAVEAVLAVTACPQDGQLPLFSFIFSDLLCTSPTTSISVSMDLECGEKAQ